MIWLLSSFIFIYFSVKKWFFTAPWPEILATALLILLAMAGIIPFFLGEYFLLPYQNAPKILFVTSGLMLLGTTFLSWKVQSISESRQYTFTVLPLTLTSVVVGLLILRSFILPLQGWDAYAMYDARARFVLEGIPFSYMATFSDYDDFNTHYYFSYPPMTSIIHATLYAAGFGSPMIVYALFMLCLFFSYLGILNMIGANRIFQLIGLGFLILNPLLMSQSNVAYTNLPMMAFQMMSLLYLIKYLYNPRMAYLFLSGLFLGFGTWTRSLEPTFVSFVFAIIFIHIGISSLSLTSKISRTVFYLFLTLIWRILWNWYVTTHVGVISAGETNPSLEQLINRLADSLALTNLFEVALFILGALRPILAYVLLMLTGLMALYLYSFPKSYKRLQIMLLIISMTILATMTAGTLYFSQTFVWWDQIGGSFLRSNLILLPLAALLAINTINAYHEWRHE